MPVVQVILSYSYRCRCGNCALNHLQNAVDCLCLKKFRNVSNLSKRRCMFRAKPQTGHNNRMCNNPPGTVQCCLTKTDGCYDQMQKIYYDRWKKASLDWFGREVSNSLRSCGLSETLLFYVYVNCELHVFQ